jgi:hypothetical protein
MTIRAQGTCTGVPGFVYRACYGLKRALVECHMLFEAPSVALRASHSADLPRIRFAEGCSCLSVSNLLDIPLQSYN